MKKIIIASCILVLSQVSLFAQQTDNQDKISKEANNGIIIKGTLSEIVNNEKVALPLANVFIEGTTYVTATDLDGHFTLEIVPGSYNLKCTFLGYDAFVKSIDHENGKHIELDILMKPESTTMLNLDASLNN